MSEQGTKDPRPAKEMEAPASHEQRPDRAIEIACTYSVGETKTFIDFNF